MVRRSGVINRRTVRRVRRLRAAIDGARVADAFVRGFEKDADGKIAGLAPGRATRVLHESMQRVAEMSEEKRRRLAALPPPDPDDDANAATCARLMLKGWSYGDIAESLGITPEQAHDYADTGFARYHGAEVRSVENAREVALARLQVKRRAIWERIVKGDLRAIEVGLKIMEREAKILGLDAPVKVDVEHRIPELARQYGIPEDELREEMRLVVKALPAGDRR